MGYSPENVLTVLTLLKLKGADEPLYWTQAGMNAEGKMTLKRVPYSQLRTASQIAYWDDFLLHAGIE